MTRQAQPSKGDRHEGRKGTPIGVAARFRKEVAPPPLRPGQHRCPVCRNGSSVTSRGNLRSHADLFGLLCPNKSTGVETGVEAPSVVLPLQPSLPRRVANVPERYGRPEGASRLDAGSECRECGKWLPGERSLCGRCYVLQERV